MCLSSCREEIFCGCVIQVIVNLNVSGGFQRVCIIDDEENVVRGKMRFSGDLVKRSEDGLLCYVCRQDDMIKRQGKRIHLREIEQVSNSHFLVLVLCFMNCTVSLGMQKIYKD